MAKTLQLHHVEGLGHPRLDLGLALAAHLQRKGEVLVHRHVRKQRVVLEHHADAALVGRHPVDGPPRQVDLAGGRRLKARQHHQRRGLAGARRPQHRHELAAGDVEVEVLHHQRFAVVALLNPGKTDHRVVRLAFGHRSSPLAATRTPLSCPCGCARQGRGGEPSGPEAPPPWRAVNGRDQRAEPGGRRSRPPNRFGSSCRRTDGCSIPKDVRRGASLDAQNLRIVAIADGVRLRGVGHRLHHAAAVSDGHDWRAQYVCGRF